MSGLNAFLVRIQRGRPALTPPYAGLGDLIYGVNLECIRTYYKAYFRGGQYTDFMRVCDAEARAMREGIEWNYGRTEKLFKICHDPDNFKMAKQNPVSLQMQQTLASFERPLTHLQYAFELLRVCHLMINIYNCVNGSSSSGYHT